MDANKEFIENSIEFNDVKTASKIRIYLVVAGDLNDRAKQLWDDENFRKSHKDDCDWIVYNFEDILNSVVIDKTKPLKINYESRPVIKHDPDSGKISIMGYVNCKKLIQICKHPNFQKSIFLENPRKTLMRTAVNKKILETIDRKDERKKFYKLNNGITGCCNRITAISDTEYEVDNFKIVNGRQTTFALAERPGGLDEISVELKIHEIENSEEMRLISRCTNNQNPIKLSDLAHGSDELRILDIKFRSYNDESIRTGKWKFELQRGDYNEHTNSEKKIFTRKRKLEKEPMARTYLAYNQRPSYAISYTEKEIFDTNSTLFTDIFDKKDVIDFILPHIFFESISQLEKKWKTDSSKANQSNLLRQKIVKFYLLSFINDSLNKLSNKKIIIKKIVETFELLNSNDVIPDYLIKIAESAYVAFEKPWKDLAKIHAIEPFDFTSARKYLIRTEDAIDAILENKHDLENYTGKDVISEQLNNV